eukprot:COSAG01_NODE_46719_length_397_cov_1.540268_1_plen_104_part_10
MAPVRSFVAVRIPTSLAWYKRCGGMLACLWLQLPAGSGWLVAGWWLAGLLAGAAACDPHSDRSRCCCLWPACGKALLCWRVLLLCGWHGRASGITDRSEILWPE